MKGISLMRSFKIIFTNTLLNSLLFFLFLLTCIEVFEVRAEELLVSDMYTIIEREGSPAGTDVANVTVEGNSVVNSGEETIFTFTIKGNPIADTKWYILDRDPDADRESTIIYAYDESVASKPLSYTDLRVYDYFGNTVSFVEPTDDEIYENAWMFFTELGKKGIKKYGDKSAKESLFLFHLAVFAKNIAEDFQIPEGNDSPSSDAFYDYNKYDVHPILWPYIEPPINYSKNPMDPPIKMYEKIQFSIPFIFNEPGTHEIHIYVRTNFILHNNTFHPDPEYGEGFTQLSRPRNIAVTEFIIPVNVNGPSILQDIDSNIRNMERVITINGYDVAEVSITGLPEIIKKNEEVDVVFDIRTKDNFSFPDSNPGDEDIIAEFHLAYDESVSSEIVYYGEDDIAKGYYSRGGSEFNISKSNPIGEIPIIGKIYQTIGQFLISLGMNAASAGWYSIFLPVIDTFTDFDFWDENQKPLSAAFTDDNIYDSSQLCMKTLTWGKFRFNAVNRISYKYKLKFTEEGYHVLHIFVKNLIEDGEGKIGDIWKAGSVEFEVPIYVDSEPPQITNLKVIDEKGTLIKDNDTASGTLNVSAKVTDNYDLKTVSFLVDGWIIDEMNIIGNDIYSIQWDTSYPGPGVHIVEILATDFNDNMNSALMPINVDNSMKLSIEPLPSVGINDTLTIQGQLKDAQEGGIEGVEVCAMMGSAAVGCDDTDSNGYYMISATAPENPGSYDVNVKARHNNNEAEETSQLEVISIIMGQDIRILPNPWSVSPTEVVPGNSTEVCTKLHNVEGSAATVSLTFKLTSPAGSIVDTKIINNIFIAAAGYSDTFCRYLSSNSSITGLHSVVAFVDYPDKNPSNNQRSSSVYVGTSTVYPEYKMYGEEFLYKNNRYPLPGHTVEVTDVRPDSCDVMVDGSGPHILGTHSWTPRMKFVQAKEVILQYSDVECADIYDYSTCYVQLNAGAASSELTALPDTLNIPKYSSGQTSFSGDSYDRISRISWETSLGVDNDRINDWDISPSRIDDKHWVVTITPNPNASPDKYEIWFYISMRNNNINYPFEFYKRIYVNLLPNHDVQVTSILDSSGNTLEGVDINADSSLVVNVRTANVGGYDEPNVKINLEVLKDGSTISVYEKELNLPKGNTKDAVFTWDTSGLSGPYSLKGTAVIPSPDPTGDNSKTVNLTVTPPPALSISAQTDAQEYLQGNEIELWTVVTDDSGPVTDANVVAHITWPDGSQTNPIMVYDLADSRYEYKFFASQVGTYSGNVTASKAGFTDGNDSLENITVSNAPPDTTITSSYPADGEWVRRNSLNFSWIGSDSGTPVSGLQYSWKIDSGEWSTPWSGNTNVIIDNLLEDSHTFCVKSYDGVLEDPEPSCRSFSVDTVEPTVTIITDGGNGEGEYFETEQAQITIQGTANDSEPSSGLSSVQINTGDTNTGSLANWSFTVDLVNGANVLDTTAFDNAGNIGSDTIIVTRIVQCKPTGNPDSNCDGVDDDCDGTPDDKYQPTLTQCGDGECATTGQWICDNGTEVNTCEPLTEPEDTEVTCDDGLDNDCDGSIDRSDIDCCTDTDNDGYAVEGGDCGPVDNCPDVYNPGQDDSDGDGEGDACDFSLPLSDEFNRPDNNDINSFWNEYQNASKIEIRNGRLIENSNLYQEVGGIKIDFPLDVKSGVIIEGDVGCWDNCSEPGGDTINFVIGADNITSFATPINKEWLPYTSSVLFKIEISQSSIIWSYDKGTNTFTTLDTLYDDVDSVILPIHFKFALDNSTFELILTEPDGKTYESNGSHSISFPNDQGYFYITYYGHPDNMKWYLDNFALSSEVIECHPYDTDCDWCIGDFELLNAIDAWAIGDLGDFELLNLIDFWAEGCYCWDAGNGKHKASTPDDLGVCQEV